MLASKRKISARKKVEKIVYTSMVGIGICAKVSMICSPLLRLLLKVTKVTTEHQKWPKMRQNSVISSLFFCPKTPWPKAEALRWS